MVRLRKHTGEVVPIDGRVAIEIVDMTGNLGAVVIQQADGAIHFITPGDPLFNAHLLVTNQRASKVVVHEPTPPGKDGKPFSLVKR
jgi:hypothetical protein